MPVFSAGKLRKCPQVRHSDTTADLWPTRPAGLARGRHTKYGQINITLSSQHWHPFRVSFLSIQCTILARSRFVSGAGCLPFITCILLFIRALTSQKCLMSDYVARVYSVSDSGFRAFVHTTMYSPFRDTARDDLMWSRLKLSPRFRSRAFLFDLFEPIFSKKSHCDHILAAAPQTIPPEGGPGGCAKPDRGGTGTRPLGTHVHPRDRRRVKAALR